MKKITLIFFMMVFSICAFAQLPTETFDTWPVGAGGWSTYQNDVGTNLEWGLNPAGSTALPSHSQPHAAYMSRANVPTGNPEDWLITPQFTVPVNAQLRFWSRLVANSDQGNRYDVLISTNPNPASGTFVSLIDNDGWGELEINPLQQTYTEKVLPIPASWTGQQVYIAFKMKAVNDGDRWLIDDVGVQQQCYDPTNLTATNPTTTGATLSWDNPSGATQWEVEIIPSTSAPTATGVVVNGPLPYTPTLNPGTAYKYYVRALCGGGNNSDWVGPYNFATVALGATCAAPKVITALPYSTTDDTSFYGDDIEGSPGATGCGATGNFLNGNEVVYSYTASFTGIISLSMTGNGPDSGMFVYDSCSNIGVSCIAGGAGDATTPVDIPSLNVVSGTTYYIVIATSGTTMSTPYNLVIQQVNCTAPGGLTATDITENNALLSWTNPSNAAAWEVAIQPAGSPIPSGSGTVVFNNTSVPASDIMPLTAGTQYQYYVRADCGNGTFSAWSGPFLFNTTLCPPANQCNWQFVMTDNYNGWEGSIMSVKQNGIVVATLGPQIGEGTGPIAVDVPVCHGAPIELFWSDGGSYFSEVGVSIVNSFGQTIYDKPIGEGSPESSLYTGTVDCLIPECLPPTGLTVTAVTETTATLNWAGPATGSWEYIVLPSGSPAPTPSTGGVPTSSNPVTAPGLTAGTNYQYYVRLVCSNGLSDWAGPFSFFTTQIPGTLTYTQGFEGANSGWALNNGDEENKWVVGTAANNGGTQSMYISNDNGVTNAYSNSNSSTVQAFRDIAIPAGSTDVSLSFDWRAIGDAFSTFNYDYLRVWVVPTTFTPTPGTQIEEGPGRQQIGGEFNQNGDWINAVYTIDASSFAGGTARFIFEWHNDSFSGENPPAAIDNINIAVVTCRMPTDIALTPDSLTMTSASFTWAAPTNSGTPTYDYYITTTNTAPDAATTPSGEVTAGTAVTVSDLLPGKTYYFWVRSDCGAANGNSFWVGPLVFNTPQIPGALNYTDNFEGEINWTFNNGNQANKWTVGTAANNGGTHSLYVTSDNGATNEYVSTLSVTQAYRDLSVPAGATSIEVNFDWRAVGEGNDFSDYDYLRVWLVPVTFTPTPGEQIAPGAGRIQLNGNFRLNSEFITASHEIDATDFDGTVMRLVFEWRNDDFAAIQTPAAIDNVNVRVVTCSMPKNLTATAITETSAQLGWTEANTSTIWSIIVQPASAPAPAFTTPGTPVPGTLPTYPATGLTSGTLYEFYVRSDCGAANGLSSWAGPFEFATLITNDECATAITVPVNPGIDCTAVGHGTVIGATASAQPSTCFGTADDDVWFQFTATATTHSIALQNILGSTEDLYHVLYAGDQCGNLTQIYCSDNNTSNAHGLLPGTVYKIRVYSYSDTPETSTFDICIRTTPPPIAVTQTMTVEELVTDVLIGSECAVITNITSSTGSNFGQANGIGYFNKNNSGFPMNEGVVLVSGNAMEAVGYNEFPLGWANDWPGWDGDADLEEAVGIPAGETNDASYIQFDFVPLIDEVSFDFLFASEEYNQGSFECTYSDSFAFILTDLTTGVSTNLAVLPGTDVPIQVTNIHPDNGVCDAINEQYFGQYNNNDYDPINFNGQTAILTASSPVQTDHVYRIKLVVANEQDNSHNSAVFLLAGSFQIGDLDLGADLLVSSGNAVCEGGSATINSQLSPADYEFEWYNGTTLIPNETASTLVVTQPGTYSVKATYIGSTCSAQSSIVVEFYPSVEDITGTPANLMECSDTGFAAFDLAVNTPVILGSLDPADYTITYHASQADAEANQGPLASPYTNVTATQTIYARIISNDYQCVAVKTFTINTAAAPAITNPGDQLPCAAYVLPALASGQSYYTAPGGPGGTGTVIASGTSITTNQTIYIYSESGTTPNCVSEQSFNVTITPIDVTAPASVSECNNYELPALTAGNYFTGPQGTGTQLDAGQVITTTQTIYVYASSGTCSDEDNFTVTITPTPNVTYTEGCENGSYVLEVIFDGDANYTADNTVIEWTSPAGGSIGNDPKVKITQPGMYILTVTPDNGLCGIEVEVPVDETGCMIQRGISPNGDGLNDSFDLTAFNVTRLSIYNRYGKEVYSYGNYTNEWHGQGDGGSELPTGTYYYMIERRSGPTVTGWIYINREE